MASVSSVAVVYALGATALAVVLMVLLHVLEPGFDPSWRILSEYSLGRYGLLMRIAFVAMGTGVIAIALAISGAARPWSLSLALVAIGPLGAAFIDTDPITTPRTQMSRRSRATSTPRSARCSTSGSRRLRPSRGSAPPATRRRGPSWPGHRSFPGSRSPGSSGQM